MMRDENTEKEKTWRNAWLMRPEQASRFGWEMVIMSFLLILGFLIPFSSAFEPDNDFLSDSLDYTSLLIFSIDMIINFNTGFYERDILVLDRYRILKNYISFWFWIDLLSTIPLDWLLNLAGTSNSQTNKLIKYVTILRVLKLLKLIRLTKLKIMILKIKDRISNKKVLSLIDIFRLLLYLFLVAHFIACTMYLVASDNMSPEGFVAKFVTKSDELVFSVEGLYVSCLYWAFTTMTSIGYGDITPSSTSERLVCILVMIISSGIFGFIIGNIGSIIEKSSYKENMRRETIVNLNCIMKKHKFSNDLKAKTRKYMDYVFLHDQNDGRNLNDLLSSLSQPLQEEIMMHTNGSILRRCEVFIIFSNTIINRFSKAMQIKIFSPQDFILKEGQESGGIHYISTGLVEIYDNHSRCKISLLSDKGYIGEIGLFTKKGCVATVAAVHFVETLHLEAEEFYKVIEIYPVVKVMVDDIRTSCSEGNYSALRIKCYLCKKIGHIAKNCSEIMDNENVKNSWILRNSAAKFMNPDTAKPKFIRTKPIRVLRKDYSVKNVVGSRRRPREMFPKVTSLVRGIVSYDKRFRMTGKTTGTILHTEESMISSYSKNMFSHPEWIISSSDDEAQPILKIRQSTFDRALLK